MLEACELVVVRRSHRQRRSGKRGRETQGDARPVWTCSAEPIHASSCWGKDKSMCVMEGLGPYRVILATLGQQVEGKCICNGGPREVSSRPTQVEVDRGRQRGAAHEIQREGHELASKSARTPLI